MGRIEVKEKEGSPGVYWFIDWYGVYQEFSYHRVVNTKPVVVLREPYLGPVPSN